MSPSGHSGVKCCAYTRDGRPTVSVTSNLRVGSWLQRCRYVELEGLLWSRVYSGQGFLVKVLFGLGIYM